MAENGTLLFDERNRAYLRTPEVELSTIFSSNRKMGGRVGGVGSPHRILSFH